MHAGSDTNPGTLWWDTSYAGFTCDNGADGVGVFREDSPEAGDNCWSVNSASARRGEPPYHVPAVEFRPQPEGSRSTTKFEAAPLAPPLRARTRANGTYFLYRVACCRRTCSEPPSCLQVAPRQAERRGPMRSARPSYCL